MPRRAFQGDRPTLPAELRDDLEIGQHGFAAAVADNLDVAPVPGEVVQGANMFV